MRLDRPVRETNPGFADIIRADHRCRKNWAPVLLIFATLAAGIYPKLLLDRILPAVEDDAVA